MRNRLLRKKRRTFMLGLDILASFSLFNATLEICIDTHSFTHNPQIFSHNFDIHIRGIYSTNNKNHTSTFHIALLFDMFSAAVYEIIQFEYVFQMHLNQLLNDEQPFKQMKKLPFVCFSVHKPLFVR